MTPGKPFLRSPVAIFAAFALPLALVALVRPIDHDESQYVAAAMLAAHGLPYRDFAYLQTPLQPMLFAAIAWAAGVFAYPALRLVNAALGAAMLAATFGAAQAAGASRKSALAATALIAATDIFLFGVSVARNDALPAALTAIALVPIVRAARGRGSSAGAVLAGLLLAAAAAAKISYALPAAAVGAYALYDRRLRPGWMIAGAIAPAALVSWTWASAPAAFRFDVLAFPALAPAEYYIANGQAWKLTTTAKAIDIVKFMALGVTLPALAMVAWQWRRGRDRQWRVLDVMLLGALVAALLPEPTWRQYLLPVLPPLAVRLALLFDHAPPGRAARIALAVFVAPGLAPSLIALAGGVAAGAPVITAIGEGRAIGRAMDRAGFGGSVATLSPQWLPATGRPVDPRFAAGPFYFRSHGLLNEGEERRFHLVSAAQLNEHFADAPPGAILAGGESKATSGNPDVDRALADWAVSHGWRRAASAGPMVLYLPPR